MQCHPVAVSHIFTTPVVVSILHDITENMHSAIEKFKNTCLAEDCRASLSKNRHFDPNDITVFWSQSRKIGTIFYQAFLGVNTTIHMVGVFFIKQRQSNHPYQVVHWLHLDPL